MKNALAGLLSSKKAIVLISTNLFIVLTMMVGLEEEHAKYIIEKSMQLASIYLGGQSLVDVGLALKEGMKARATVAPEEKQS